MPPSSKAQPHQGVERSGKILLGRQGRMEGESPRTSGLYVALLFIMLAVGTQDLVHDSEVLYLTELHPQNTGDA